MQKTKFEHLWEFNHPIIKGCQKQRCWLEKSYQLTCHWNSTWLCHRSMQKYQIPSIIQIKSLYCNAQLQQQRLCDWKCSSTALGDRFNHLLKHRLSQSPCKESVSTKNRKIARVKSRCALQPSHMQTSTGCLFKLTICDFVLIVQTVPTIFKAARRQVIRRYRWFTQQMGNQHSQFLLPIFPFYFSRDKWRIFSSRHTSGELHRGNS